jgi:hypothetical protein
MRLAFSVVALVAVVMTALAHAQGYVNGQLQIAQPTPNMDYLNATGVKMSPDIPFYRIGEPAVIPFTPASGGVEVAVSVPAGATSFQATVNAPCAVRLRGKLAGAAFVAVTSTTGWLWMPGTSRVYTSLQPLSVAAMGVDGPNASVQAAQKACSGTVELQYGTGK